MKEKIMTNIEILDFWTEFIQSYNDWFYLPISHDASVNYDTTLEGFCKNQKLSFCDYCEPMCEINQNCNTDPIAVICDVVSATSMMVTDVGWAHVSPNDGTYWSLVQTCCNKCRNYQCNISMVNNASFSLEPSKDIKPPLISVTPPEENEHLLQILIPLVIFNVLSIVAFAAFCLRKKRKSIKYKPLCQFEILSESEVSAEAEDRTEISITDLWDQINNHNDGNDSIKMKSIKNNAPLACVLRSSDNSDSEV